MKSLEADVVYRAPNVQYNSNLAL